MKITWEPWGRPPVLGQGQIRAKKAGMAVIKFKNTEERGLNWQGENKKDLKIWLSNLVAYLKENKYEMK